MERVVIATVALLAFGTCADAQDAQPKFSVPYITVRASAAVQVQPDQAVLQLGAVAEKPTSAAAFSEVSRETATMIADLKSKGIAVEDIRTSTIRLEPMIIEERDPQTRQVVKRTMSGYRATSNLDVNVRKIGMTGEIISSVIAKGANNFRSISFKVSDESKREDEVRLSALRNAKEKAASLAHEANAELGRVLLIEPNPVNDGAADLPSRTPPIGPVTAVIPIEPGLKQLYAEIAVTWELVQQQK